MSFYLCNLLFAHGGVATLGSTVSMLLPRRAHLAAGQREPRDFITATASLPLDVLDSQGGGGLHGFQLLSGNPLASFSEGHGRTEVF